MFKFEHTTFGRNDKITFFDDKENRFSLSPNYGGCLLELVFEGENVLDSYSTPEELAENKWSKSAFLYPYPNRLRDGKYKHNGKTYQFAINNAATQNSIHGFGKDVPMRVVKTSVKENEASVKLRFKHDGKNLSYPFKFSMDITMGFKRAFTDKKKKKHTAEFSVEMKFKNQSAHAIPVGLGWHPYFKISEKVDDTALFMPSVQKIDIDARMLPTGTFSKFENFKSWQTIGDTVLDNGFLIKQTDEKIAQICIKTNTAELKFWQEIGPAKWNYTQIFTPPHRNSIAIEPMTCNIDAFNNKDGLLLLTPKAVLDGKFGVRFERIGS